MDWFLHNPIGDMPGPQFLVFYLLVIVLTTVGASLWRKAADPTRGLAPPSVPLYPDPYEIAFLRGGENEVLRSVLFNLVQKGFLVVLDQKDKAAKRGEERIIRRAEQHPDPDTLNPLERRVMGWLDHTPRTASSIFNGGLPKTVEEFCGVYEEHLVRQQLMPPTARRFGSTQFLAGVGLVWSLGLYKLAVAAAKGHHNVGFLILFGLLALIPLAAVSFSSRRVTARGRAYLEQLRTAFQPVKAGAPAVAAPGPDPALPVLVGVFGMGILGSTSYYYMPQMFQRGSPTGTAVAIGASKGVRRPGRGSGSRG
jgi:uncharacterized protein (TIGR04222 family)